MKMIFYSTTFETFLFSWLNENTFVVLLRFFSYRWSFSFYSSSLQKSDFWRIEKTNLQHKINPIVFVHSSNYFYNYIYYIALQLWLKTEFSTIAQMLLNSELSNRITSWMGELRHEKIMKTLYKFKT